MAIAADFAPVRSTGFNAWLERLSTDYRVWRSYRKTYAELSRLSDRELDDIGLHRSQIGAVARGHQV